MRVSTRWLRRGDNNERIARSAVRRPVGDAVKGRGVPVAVREAAGVIGGGNAQHVFIGARPKLGQAVDFHGAGVGDQYDFGAFEHQNARAFGKFPVKADQSFLGLIASSTLLV